MSSASLLRSLPCPSTTSSPSIRRRSLLLLSPVIPTLSIFTPPSRARDIPLFGLRKKVKEVEEEAEEIVREGEKAVEGEILAAEEGIAGGLGFGLGLGSGDLVQAAAVAGAEAVGVLIGVSVVNGILGTEGKN